MTQLKILRNWNKETMENSALIKEIEEKIALCERQFQENIDNSFLSHVLDSELYRLRYLYDRVKETDDSEIKGLIRELKESLAEAEEEKKREEEHPSFDWYDEHYQYKVLEGYCDAYRSVIGILEKYQAGWN